MDTTWNRPGSLLLTLLRGGGLMVVLLWCGMSFVPVARLFYGDLSAIQRAVEVIFFATGVAGFAALYALISFVATNRTKRALTPSNIRVLDWAGLYAVVWILLYSVVA